MDGTGHTVLLEGFLDQVLIVRRIINRQNRDTFHSLKPSCADCGEMGLAWSKIAVTNPAKNVPSTRLISINFRIHFGEIQIKLNILRVNHRGCQEFPFHDYPLFWEGQTRSGFDP